MNFLALLLLPLVTLMPVSATSSTTTATTAYPLLVQDIAIVTQLGSIADITAGKTAYLVADVQNYYPRPQDFSAITEVIDTNGDTASIKWYNANLEGMQTIRTSSIWIPEEAGNYTVKILIWTSNIVDKSPPVALAEPKSMTLQIYDHPHVP